MSKGVQYYFCDQFDRDFSYTKEYLVAKMVEKNLPSISVRMGRRVLNTEWFYCKEYGEVYDKEQGGCGISCKGYVPRNGKSGCCTHRGYCYEPEGDPILWVNPNHIDSIKQDFTHSTVIEKSESFLKQVLNQNIPILLLIAFMTICFLIINLFV